MTQNGILIIETRVPARKAPSLYTPWTIAEALYMQKMNVDKMCSTIFSSIRDRFQNKKNKDHGQVGSASLY